MGTYRSKTPLFLCKKVPLFARGKHVVPFENDFFISLTTVEVPRAKGGIKESVMWNIYNSFKFNGLPEKTS